MFYSGNLSQRLKKSILTCFCALRTGDGGSAVSGIRFRARLYGQRSVHDARVSAQTLRRPTNPRLPLRPRPPSLRLHQDFRN